MQTREISPLAGKFCWAVYTHNYPLPEDLPHRTLVKIIENRVGKVTVIVENREAKRWEILRCNVVPRLQYQYSFDEKWYPEGSERAQTILMNEIRREWSNLEHLQKRIEELYWRARRSGSPAAVAALERSLATFDPIGDYDASPAPPMKNPMHPGEGAGDAVRCAKILKDYLVRDSSAP